MEKIEGLSIGLGLDTLKLDSGLTDLKGKLKLVNSEMKANLSAFDRADKSLEKYETRLHGLNKKLEVQKAITDKAKTSYEKMVKDHGLGSKEADDAAKSYNNEAAALNNLERYVGSVRDELKKLTDEQRFAESSWGRMSKRLDETGTRLTSIGDNLLGVGKSISLGVTVPLSVLGSLAIKSASDFQKSQGKMQASLGLTADEAKKMNGAAKNIWETGFGENMEEASQGIIDVKKNLQTITGKELEAVTRQAFILRDTFGYDIPESTRAAKSLIDNFGVDAAKAMDYITVASQKGGDYSEELLDTISEYSVQFKTAGMDIGGMFNILIQGAQNGAWNLDKVGDAVKEFSVRAVDGSKTTAAGFSTIGLNADEMGKKFAEGGDSAEKAFMATVAALSSVEDPLEQQQAGVALFGTQWEDVQKNVIGALNPTVDMLGNVEGATKKAGEALQDNFSDRAIKELRNLGASLMPLGNILLDKIQPGLEGASEHIKEFTEWMESLSPAGKNAVITIGAIALAAGPVAIGLGAVVNGVSAVTGALGKGIGTLGRYQGSLTLTRSSTHLTNLSIEECSSWEDPFFGSGVISV
ncbi:phage tail tape measure protein [Peribacillus phoenicis]|uniref:phage tail tape measure protein n=1 Tax=unclassified Peribacillus TaxID=2675266 RepID=UPI0039A17A4F